MKSLITTVKLLAFVLVLPFSVDCQQHITSTTQAYVFPEFLPAKVYYANGKNSGGAMNYNVVQEAMVVQLGDAYAEFESPNKVDSIVFGARKFIPADEKYYEVLREDGKNDLLYLHKTIVRYVGQDIGYGAKSKETRVQNVRMIGANFSQYKLDIDDDHELEPLSGYVMKSGDSLEKFSNDRQFAKIFPKYKKQIKSFLDDNNINFEDYEDVLKAYDFVKDF
jgi:hypothetical protein